MKIIVWLWNPWEKYKKTKHNLWFIFLDFLQKKQNFSEFQFEKKFQWEISNWIINSEKIILLKPQTFMNLSWEALKKIVNFYKIDTKDFIIIFDDISMDFWKIRFREKWSAWWHNWIKNIISFFWDSFKRIKVWVWFNKNYEVSDWVLSKFKDEEIDLLEDEIYNNIIELLIEKILFKK